MNTLTRHIEYLLTRHDCVIIPGFGGLVLLSEEASFVDGGFMCTPQKTASFNSSLTYNDGLLANSIMREQGISFNEAMSLIDEQVKDLSRRLLKHEQVMMGSVGVFSLGADGLMQFSPAEENMFNLNMFGFSDLKLKTIDEIEAEEREAYQSQIETAPKVVASIDRDVVMIPVNMRILRRVAAVACMVVGLLLFSHPLEQNNLPENYASFISMQLMKRAIVPNVPDIPDIDFYGDDDVIYSDDDIKRRSKVKISLEEEYDAGKMTEECEVDTMLLTRTDIDAVESKTAASSKEKQPKREAVAIKESVEQDVETAVQKKETASASDKKFFIIVGSFPTEQLAEKGVEALINKGLTDSETVFNSNRYRVSVSSFETRKDANNFLADLKRRFQEYSDAWILAITD